MYFPNERVNTLTRELGQLVVVQNVALEKLLWKEGFYLTPAQADAAQEPYTGFNCAADTWDGEDTHYWFTTEVTVPESFDGKPLWIGVTTQQNGWDASNPQFPVFPGRQRYPSSGNGYQPP